MLSITILNIIFKTIFKMIFHPVFIGIIGLVGWQYYKIVKRKKITNGRKNVILEVAYATFFGIIGGIIGSIFLILTGISFSDIGITYLWVLALILLLVHPRFICFSYSGGIISLSYILFGWPRVDVPQLMGLIAILHLVESLLIILSGWINPIPTFIKNRRKEITKGFSMQKFWPIPIVGLIIINPTIGIDFDSIIHTPDWWPLIKPAFQKITTDLNYQFVPVFVALGYGDIAITNYPRKRSLRTGIALLMYSIILLILSIVSSYLRFLVILPALFGPLAHEYLIQSGQKSELEGKAMDVVAEDEVMDYITIGNKGFLSKWWSKMNKK